MRWLRCISLIMIVVGAAVDGGLATAAEPPERKPANPVDIARLDAKMKDVSKSFMRETTTLIKGYEAIGEFDRARVVLEALRKLDPDNAEVKRKLQELEQRQLDKTQFAVEIDPGKGWVPVGIVTNGAPLRIRVRGEYRFSASASVGADGMPTNDPVKDLAAGMPVGAVLGAIAPPAGDAGRRPEEPPTPFLVGSEFESPAEADGILYLRVNLPADAKCTGRLEALVGGATKP